MSQTALVLSGELTMPEKTGLNQPGPTTGRPSYGSTGTTDGLSDHESKSPHEAAEKGAVTSSWKPPIPEKPQGLFMHVGADSDKAEDTRRGSTTGRNSSSSMRKSASSSRLYSSRRRSSGWSIRGTEVVVPFSLTRAKIAITLIVSFCGMALSPSNVLLGNYLTKRMVMEKMMSNTSFTFPSVQADVVEKQIYYNYATCFPALLMLLIMTAYSDFVGRRLQVVLSTIGQTTKLGLLYWIMRYNKDYCYIYLAFFLDGICGSWFLGMSSLLTVTADINVVKKTRTWWLVIAAAIINIMFASSCFINYYFLDDYEIYEICAIFAGYTGFAFLVALFLLPETLPPQETKEWHPLRSLQRLFSLFLFNSKLKHRLTFFTCMLMFFFGCIDDVSVLFMDIQYLLGEPFRWDLQKEFYYTGYRAGISPLVGIMLLFLLQRYGIKGEYIAMAGSVFMAGAYVLEGVANKSWHIYTVIALLAPGTLVNPTLRGIMSILAGPEYQGAVFSSIAIIENMATITSHSIFNRIYVHTVDNFSGTVYLCMAGFAIMPFFLFFFYFAVYERGDHEFDYEVFVETPDKSESFVQSSLNSETSSSISMVDSRSRSGRKSLK